MHGSAPTRPRRSVITSIAVFATTKWKATAAFFAVVVIAGLSAFTFGLDREGFPPINTPISVVSGTWFVDDATIVDDELVRPFKEQFETVEGVVSVDSEARPSSFAIVVEFDSDIDSATGTARLADLDLASTRRGRRDLQRGECCEARRPIRRAGVGDRASGRRARRPRSSSGIARRLPVRRRCHRHRRRARPAHHVDRPVDWCGGTTPDTVHPGRTLE